MAEEGVFAGKAICLGKYDLSCKLTAAQIQAEVDVKDDTTVCDDTRSEAAGLNVVRFEGAGLFDSDNDGQLYSNLSVHDVELSFFPAGKTEGVTAYTFQAHQANYEMGGPLGELLGYRLSANSRGTPLVRGYVMHASTKSIPVDGSSGNATPLQIGAIAATETLFIATHVTALTGTSPTISLSLFSDDAEGFPSQTNRKDICTAQASTASFWDSVSGAVTDDWWRVWWSLGGAGTSATFYVVAGIMSN
jgi:hypothetical protein